MVTSNNKTHIPLMTVFLPVESIISTRTHIGEVKLPFTTYNWFKQPSLYYETHWFFSTKTHWWFSTKPLFVCLLLSTKRVGGRHDGSVTNMGWVVNKAERVGPLIRAGWSTAWVEVSWKQEHSSHSTCPSTTRCLRE